MLQRSARLVQPEAGIEAVNDDLIVVDLHGICAIVRPVLLAWSTPEPSPTHEIGH